VDEVMKLVAERAKYEKFLAELDKDAASKPANVVARVRADYSTKLEAVAAKLKSNYDVLTEHAATLTTQLQKLQDAEKRFADEAAELDLRKQVGEIPEEEWQTAVDRVNADASKIKKQQEVTDADIKRIRELLASFKPKTDTPAPAPVGDELAFLKAVVGQSTVPTPQAKRPSAPAAAAPPVARPSVVVKPIGPPPRPSSGTPEPRPSTIAKQVEPLIEPDPMSVPSAPITAAPVKPPKRPTPTKESLIEAPQADIGITAKGGDSKPLAANVPTGELNLRSMGSPTATKKAKCPKCAGLNVPSDWYCVHCGAELAI
jgi:hypothetical protein